MTRRTITEGSVPALSAVLDALLLHGPEGEEPLRLRQKFESDFPGESDLMTQEWDRMIQANTWP